MMNAAMYVKADTKIKQTQTREKDEKYYKTYNNNCAYF